MLKRVSFYLLSEGIRVRSKIQSIMIFLLSQNSFCMLEFLSPVVERLPRHLLRTDKVKEKQKSRIEAGLKAGESFYKLIRTQTPMYYRGIVIHKLWEINSSNVEKNVSKSSLLHVHLILKNMVSWIMCLVGFSLEKYGVRTTGSHYS